MIFLKIAPPLSKEGIRGNRVGGKFLQNLPVIRLRLIVVFLSDGNLAQQVKDIRDEMMIGIFFKDLLHKIARLVVFFRLEVQHARLVNSIGGQRIGWVGFGNFQKRGTGFNGVPGAQKALSHVEIGLGSQLAFGMVAHQQIKTACCLLPGFLLNEYPAESVVAF